MYNFGKKSSREMKVGKEIKLHLKVYCKIDKDMIKKVHCKMCQNKTFFPSFKRCFLRDKYKLETRKNVHHCVLKRMGEIPLGHTYFYLSKWQRGVNISYLPNNVNFQ